MPYIVREEEGQFCVYKRDTDEKMGCHPSKAEAMDQVGALYANEKAQRPSLFITPTEGEKSDPPDEETEEVEAHEEDAPEAEEMHELPHAPGDLPDVEPPEPREEEDKSAAHWQDVAVGLEPVPVQLAADEAPDPAFWTEAPVAQAKSYTQEDVARMIDEAVSKAVAALPETTSTTSTGSNSTAVTVRFDAAKDTREPSVFDRARKWLKSQFSVEREATGLKVAGNHWLIVHSNNFRDRDGEIFTKEAIERQIGRMDRGVIPYPALWVWHEGKAFKIGETQMVAYHDHFTLSAGEFDTTPHAQKARDYYASNAHKTRVSHGFAFPPEQFDGKHYHDFNTFEISLLPRGVEANLFTSLEGVKAMALTPKKRAYLEEVFGKEYVEEKLNDLTERGKALEELGVEFKDFSDTTPDATPAQTEAVKALTADALEASGLAVETSLALAKQFKAMQVEWKQMKDDFAGRPRKASEAPETELTESNIDARMGNIRDAVEQQATVKNAFWGTDEKKVGV